MSFVAVNVQVLPARRLSVSGDMPPGPNVASDPFGVFILIIDLKSVVDVPLFLTLNENLIDSDAAYVLLSVLIWLISNIIGTVTVKASETSLESYSGGTINPPL